MQAPIGAQQLGGGGVRGHASPGNFVTMGSKERFSCILGMDWRGKISFLQNADLQPFGGGMGRPTSPPQGTGL